MEPNSKIFLIRFSVDWGDIALLITSESNGRRWVASDAAAPSKDKEPIQGAPIAGARNPELLISQSGLRAFLMNH